MVVLLIEKLPLCIYMHGIYSLKKHRKQVKILTFICFKYSFLSFIGLCLLWKRAFITEERKLYMFETTYTVSWQVSCLNLWDIVKDSFA